MRLPLSHQVDEAPRRRHHKIDTRPQRFDLWTFAHAAENGGHSQWKMSRIGAYILVDLNHELSRRSDDQRTQHAPFAVRIGGGQLGKDRPNECSRFSRSSLRDPDDIASSQDLWNGRELNGRRLGVTSFLDGFENWRGEV